MEAGSPKLRAKLEKLNEVIEMDRFTKQSNHRDGDESINNRAPIGPGDAKNTIKPRVLL